MHVIPMVFMYSDDPPRRMSAVMLVKPMHIASKSSDGGFCLEVTESCRSGRVTEVKPFSFYLHI
jgi:hypothetical protein